MRRWLVFFLALCCGCSAGELRKEFFGLNPQDVRQSNHAYVATLEGTADKCFSQALDELRGMKAVARAVNRKKKFVVARQFDGVFKSCIDTTEAALLFTAEGTRTTKLTVVSDNHNLAEYVCAAMAARLGKNVSARKN